MASRSKKSTVMLSISSLLCTIGTRHHRILIHIHQLSDFVGVSTTSGKIIENVIACLTKDDAGWRNNVFDMVAAKKGTFMSMCCMCLSVLVFPVTLGFETEAGATERSGR